MTRKADLKNMKFKDYVMVFFKGILLGLISVGIPGISASTIGIIVGIYFLMVEAIANVFKDFKHNFPFLIILILGYGAGAVGAAASVSILYDKYPFIVTFAILGFLFGALPDMIKDLKGGFKRWSNWLCLIAVVALLIVYNFTIQKNAQITFPEDPSWGFLAIMVGVGAVTSATFVIPGVDFAVVFLSMGIYYAFTNMILDLVSFGAENYAEMFVTNAKILGAYLIGYFIGIFLFSKLIKTLSKKYDSQTRFASLGFVVASPVIVVKSCIYDNTSFDISEVTRGEVIVGFGVAVIFLWLTILIMRKTREKKMDGTAPLEESTVDNRWHMDRRLRSVFFHQCLTACYLDKTLKKRNKKEHTVDDAYRFCVQYVKKYFGYMDVEVERFGVENLTKCEGGVMYMGNHQGKNDCLLVLNSIEEHPATFLINDDRSHMFLMGPITDYMGAKRIKFNDLKSQLEVYQEVTEDLSKGISYVVFPEAMYNDNKNSLNNFNTPCFLPVIKSKRPIIPFVLYDTWKISEPSIKGHLKVQIHFLEPILYEEYKGLNKRALAELLRCRIREKLIELDEGKTFPIEEELMKEEK